MSSSRWWDGATLTDPVMREVFRFLKLVTTQRTPPVLINNSVLLLFTTPLSPYTYIHTYIGSIHTYIHTTEKTVLGMVKGWVRVGVA